MPNKIIINPHHCSREEYQELKNYLTEKTWDWQEVSSGNEDDGISGQDRQNYTDTQDRKNYIIED